MEIGLSISQVKEATKLIQMDEQKRLLEQPALS